MAASSPRRLSIPIDNRWGAGEMAVLEFGDPSRPVDLVFVHANGFNAMTYRTLLAPLADHYRIRAPDLRGHGHTRLPTERVGRRGWADHAADLIGLLESIEGPPVVLAGHSMGGTSALLAAAQRPERVAALVLMEAVIWPPLTALIFNLPLLDKLPSRGSIVTGTLKRRAAFDSREQALAAYSGRGAFKGWPQEVLADYLTDGLVEAGNGFTLACDPKWEASNYALHAHDAWGALRRYPGPVRVLKGETGWATAMPVGQRGKVRVETVPGGDHFFPMLLPDAARAALTESLAGVGSRAPQAVGA